MCILTLRSGLLRMPGGPSARQREAPTGFLAPTTGIRSTRSHAINWRPPGGALPLPARTRGGYYEQNKRAGGRALASLLTPRRASVCLPSSGLLVGALVIASSPAWLSPYSDLVAAPVPVEGMFALLHLRVRLSLGFLIQTKSSQIKGIAEGGVNYFCTHINCSGL